jgi:methylated-DNA-[protein]-cysteine S-methyltransferase
LASAALRPTSSRATAAARVALAPDDYSACVATPFAVLGIRCDAHGVTGVDYLATTHALRAPVSPMAARTVADIERYLADPDYRFRVALQPRGTPFQQRVWQAILDIPSGESRTYGKLAQKLVSAPRAVGQACGSNPIALIIPCHRVTGSRGDLGGFMHSTASDPLRIKRWLLAHERRFFDAPLLA